jgi:hypothetical protein
MSKIETTKEDIQNWESICFDCGDKDNLTKISEGVTLCPKCYTIKRVEQKKTIKEYPLLSQEGYISIENNPVEGLIKGVLGIQIAADGRVWVCVDGISLLRFRPKLKGGD